MEVDSVVGSCPARLARCELQQGGRCGGRRRERAVGDARVISVVKDLVGDRPAGSTSTDASIVQTAIAVGERSDCVWGLPKGRPTRTCP